MNPVADVTNAVLEQSMTGQILNREQARHLDELARLVHDASPEIDSIVEHAACLLRPCTPDEIRHHAAEIFKKSAALKRNVAAVDESNDSELACHRALPALVERRSRGVKEAARRLRDPLANLLNPMIVGQLEREALGLVHDVIAEFGMATLRQPSLENELHSPRRYRLLVQLLDGVEERS